MNIKKQNKELLERIEKLETKVGKLEQELEGMRFLKHLLNKNDFEQDRLLLHFSTKNFD